MGNGSASTHPAAWEVTDPPASPAAAVFTTTGTTRTSVPGKRRSRAAKESTAAKSRSTTAGRRTRVFQREAGGGIGVSRRSAERSDSDMGGSLGTDPGNRGRGRTTGSRLDPEGED